MTDIAEIIAAAIRPYMADLPDAGMAAGDVLTALQKRGFAVVPVVPTEEMVKAGGASLAQYIEALSEEERAKLKPRPKRTGEMLGYKIRPDLKCSIRWSAMLAASPGSSGGKDWPWDEATESQAYEPWMGPRKD
jgi:hypothetical protein